MAELRLCFGRRANDIAHKICRRHLVDTRNKQGKHATHALFLSAGFLTVDIKNDGLFGAGNTADSVTGAVHRDRYATANRPFAARSETRGNEYELNNESSLYEAIRTGGGRRFGRYRSRLEFRRTFCRPGTPLGPRCWRLQQVFIRPYSGDADRSVPLYKTKTGYYEILGVSATATHAQVKTAYYKQSFLYHPDRNAGSDEATVRFSDISEAYAVLGNKALRKKYDRGLLSLSDLTATTRPSAKDTGSPARQQAESRRSVMDADSRGGGGGGGMFDFDKFIKSHYNEQLQRERDIRVRREIKLQQKEQYKGQWTLDRALEVGAGSLLVIAVGIVLSLRGG